MLDPLFVASPEKLTCECFSNLGCCKCC